MADISHTLVKSLFDYKDGNLYWKKNNKLAGSLKPLGYIVIEVNNVNIMAHRLVWLYHNEHLDGYIDHIDGNRSNNRIENLRIATKAQNSWNRKNNFNNKTGVKGVRLRKDNNKFEVRICVNKKRYVLGSYDDLELAELVMMEARDKYHGKFANHG
jgi:uncharacterized protein YkuJ